MQHVERSQIQTTPCICHYAVHASNLLVTNHDISDMLGPHPVLFFAKKLKSHCARSEDSEAAGKATTVLLPT